MAQNMSTIFAVRPVEDQWLIILRVLIEIFYNREFGVRIPKMDTHTPVIFYTSTCSSCLDFPPWPASVVKSWSLDVVGHCNYTFIKGMPGNWATEYIRIYNMVIYMKTCIKYVFNGRFTRNGLFVYKNKLDCTVYVGKSLFWLSNVLFYFILTNVLYFELEMMMVH